MAGAIRRCHSWEQASSALTQLQRLLHPVKPRTGSFAAFSSPSDSLYHQRNIRCEKLEAANTLKTQIDRLLPGTPPARCGLPCHCNICCVAVHCAYPAFLPAEVHCL